MTPKYELGIQVTGSRKLHDYAYVSSILKSEAEGRFFVRLRHGKAEGADLTAGRAALILGWDVKEHPAEWSVNKRAAGLVRNITMTEEFISDSECSEKIVVAFPLPDSRGTIHCIKYALSRGLKVNVYEYPETIPIEGSEFIQTRGL